MRSRDAPDGDGLYAFNLTDNMVAVIDPTTGARIVDVPIARGRLTPPACAKPAFGFVLRSSDSIFRAMDNVAQKTVLRFLWLKGF